MPAWAQHSPLAGGTMSTARHDAAQKGEPWKDRLFATWFTEGDVPRLSLGAFLAAQAGMH